MRKTKLSEEQIVHLLRRHEAGEKTKDLCREVGISEFTFYRWRAKFGGMDVSEAKRLKQLEDENSKLKRLVADLSLDNATLKGLLGKKW